MPTRAIPTPETISQPAPATSRRPPNPMTSVRVPIPSKLIRVRARIPSKLIRARASIPPEAMVRVVRVGPRAAPADEQGQGDAQSEQKGAVRLRDQRDLGEGSRRLRAGPGR